LNSPPQKRGLEKSKGEEEKKRIAEPAPNQKKWGGLIHHPNTVKQGRQRKGKDFGKTQVSTQRGRTGFGTAAEGKTKTKKTGNLKSLKKQGKTRR